MPCPFPAAAIMQACYCPDGYSEGSQHVKCRPQGIVIIFITLPLVFGVSLSVLNATWHVNYLNQLLIKFHPSVS